jgi:hypothetical protein
MLVDADFTLGMDKFSDKVRFINTMDRDGMFVVEFFNDFDEPNYWVPMYVYSKMETGVYYSNNNSEHYLENCYPDKIKSWLYQYKDQFSFHELIIWLNFMVLQIHMNKS